MSAQPPDACCPRWALNLVLLGLVASGCVVSEFDRARQSSEARAGCESDSGEDAAEACEAEVEAGTDSGEGDTSAAPTPLDASAEGEAGSLDASPTDAGNDGAAAQRDAELADAGASSQQDTGSALLCGDTFADPKNCGQCGFDCAATNADVACENKTCVRACQDGWGDCNSNLQLGAMNDGCERRVDNDVANCGTCRRRCTPPDYGFATCKAQLCTGHRLVQGARSKGTLYGNPSGGGPFDLQCPDGQVVTGIEGVGDFVAYGLKARCAALKVSRSGTTSSVSTVSPPSYTPLVGGNITGPPPAYQLLCPDGQVVSALGGTLWIYPGSGVNTKVVKTLTITCAGVTLEGDSKVSVVPKGKLTIGEPETAAAVAFETVCPGAGAIGGFSGRAGAYVDGIATLCGALAIVEQPTGAVTVATAE